MPQVERVMFAVETPNGVLETRSMPEAMGHAEKLLIAGGHRDGYYVKLSVRIVPDEDDGGSE